jgi:Transglycosylase-like domain/Putative peptidoglycan binding domain
VGIDRDLSSPLPWRRSLRASQARRLKRDRRRRRALRGRAGIALTLVLTTAAAAGALAQTPAPPGSIGATNAGDSAAGASVAAIQRALGVPADGVYGPRTRAAVRRFQRRHGLAVDGVAGPQTLAALGLSAGSHDGDSSDAGAAGSTGSDGSAKGATSGDAASASATLERIAQCESGGDPTAVSADGVYRGKYQFDRATWERLGGTGDPAQASEAEQDRLAAKLLAQSGTSPWPNCG